MSNPKQLIPGLNRLVLLLALLGLALAVVSLNHYVKIHSGTTAPSFCNINELLNCDAVNKSSWSEIWGFPVASLAITFYLSIILLSLTPMTTLARDTYESILAAISAFGLIISVVLLSISISVIGALCLVCLGMDAVNLFLFLTVALAGDKERAYSEKLSQGIRYFLWWPFIFVGLIKSPAINQARLAVVFIVVILGASYSMKEIFSRTQSHYLQDLPTEFVLSIAGWKSQPKVNIPISVNNELSTDYAIGSPDSPIRIVEFADFECPACQSFFPVLEQVLEEFSGKIYYSFKNYPLDKGCNPNIKEGGHLNACYLAELSRCSGEQGKYWETVKLLFDFGGTLHQLGVKDPLEYRSRIEQQLQKSGWDMEAIYSCLTSGRQKGKIVSDVALGDQLRMTGTPSLWINERKVLDLRAKSLSAIIGSILNESPKK